MRVRKVGSKAVKLTNTSSIFASDVDTADLVDDLEAEREADVEFDVLVSDVDSFEGCDSVAGTDAEEYGSIAFVRLS